MGGYLAAAFPIFLVFCVERKQGQWEKLFQSLLKKEEKADIYGLQICSRQASSLLHYLVNNKECWGPRGCVIIKHSVLSLSELGLNGDSFQAR